MATFLTAPDDDPDTYNRTYAVLPNMPNVTTYPVVAPVIVAPENVVNYTYPIGHAYA